MKNNIIILLFPFIFNFAWCSDTIVSFHGSRIKLSQDFIEYSEDELMIFKSINFDRQIMTVYQKSDHLGGLQRIIVYYDSLTGIKNLPFEKLVEIKLEIIEESGITFNDVIIDVLNHCVYGKTIVQGDTSIFGFAIDGFGIMGIQFNNSNGINAKDEKRFEDLMKTIKHNSPYHYVPEDSPQEKEAKEEMNYSGLLMAIAFGAMILVWLVRKYVVKN